MNRMEQKQKAVIIGLQIGLIAIFVYTHTLWVLDLKTLQLKTPYCPLCTEHSCALLTWTDQRKLVPGPIAKLGSALTESCGMGD